MPTQNPSSRDDTVTLKGVPAEVIDRTFADLDRNLAWLQAGIDGALAATVAADRWDPLKVSLRTADMALACLRENAADLATVYLHERRLRPGQ